MSKEVQGEQLMDLMNESWMTEDKLDNLTMA